MTQNPPTSNIPGYYYATSPVAAPLVTSMMAKGLVTVYPMMMPADYSIPQQASQLYQAPLPQLQSPVTTPTRVQQHQQQQHLPEGLHVKYDQRNRGGHKWRCVRGELRADLSVHCRTNAVSPPAYAGVSSNGYINGARTTAVFQFILGLAVDSTGALFIADADNYVLRWIVSGSNDVTTAVGTHKRKIPDGATASAGFDYPRYLAVDSNDDVYIEDGPSVRLWDRGGGTVSTSVGIFYAMAVSPTGVVYTT